MLSEEDRFCKSVQELRYLARLKDRDLRAHGSIPKHPPCVRAGIAAPQLVYTYLDRYYCLGDIIVHWGWEMSDKIEAACLNRSVGNKVVRSLRLKKDDLILIDGEAPPRQWQIPKRLCDGAPRSVFIVAAPSTWGNKEFQAGIESMDADEFVHLY
jgi:hypothetical protein